MSVRWGIRSDVSADKQKYRAVKFKFHNFFPWITQFMKDIEKLNFSGNNAD